MSELDKVTGQKINYKEGNDNAPPAYSAPDALFKNTLRFHANPRCSRCRGTGYIGSFKSIAGGRCFQCISDERWEDLLGKLICTGRDDNSGLRVCEIRYISSKEYSSSGYIVTRVGLPPIESTPVFSTSEEACNLASQLYRV